MMTENERRAAASERQGSPRIDALVAERDRHAAEVMRRARAEGLFYNGEESEMTCECAECCQSRDYAVMVSAAQKAVTWWRAYGRDGAFDAGWYRFDVAGGW